jgi:hypothetical protein
MAIPKRAGQRPAIEQIARMSGPGCVGLGSASGVFIGRMLVLPRPLKRAGRWVRVHLRVRSCVNIMCF